MGKDVIETTVSATTASATNATPKIIKKKGKKRKISKHILDAKMKTMTTLGSTTNGDDDSSNLADVTTISHPKSNSISQIEPIVPTISIKKQKTKKEKKHVKDPVDVEGYLMSWKDNEQQQQEQTTNVNIDSDDGDNDDDNDNRKNGNPSGTNSEKKAWKFNKNTQSWLIRHLYDSTKISKHIFTVATEYFLKSNINVQQRLKQDAIQRIVQYQQTNKDKESRTTNDDETGMTDEEKNQRKQYKRARKIVEMFTTNSES